MFRILMKQLLTSGFVSLSLMLASAATAKTTESLTPLLSFKAGKLSQSDYTQATRQLLIKQVAEQKAEVLPSGVAYSILKKDSKVALIKTPQGKSTVKASSSVEVKFKVHHPDGSLVSDEHAKTSVKIPVDLMIAAWREVLLLVGSPGLQIRIFSPYDAAYGPQGDQRIPPYSDLIFDIELISVTK